MKVLAINGSYRDGGIIDQAVGAAVETARRSGAEVEVVHLRDYPIEFCRNCRECTQRPGESPGLCVQRDGMDSLTRKIEAADRFILASPTNCFTVTALFKRFMERLIVFAYWPWGMHGPRLRKQRLTKQALVMTSSAAPGPIARLFFSSLRALKTTARTMGARPTGGICIGLAGEAPHPWLRVADMRRIERATEAIVRLPAA